MTNVTPLPTREQARLHQRVAANVRAEMARVGVTQADLAEALHITQQSVSAKRSGKTPFTLNDLETIAPMFGMDVLELISGMRDPRQGGPSGGAAAGLFGVRPPGLEPGTQCLGATCAGCGGVGCEESAGLADVIVGPWADLAEGGAA